MVKKLLGSHPNEPLHFGLQLFLFNHKCFYVIISGANHNTSLNRTAVLWSNLSKQSYHFEA